MEAFRRLDAVACPLPFAGIDTDQLIPARFMSRSRAQGYGEYLLHDLRFSEDGTLRPDFPLNRPERHGTRILVARRNFGAGSSREAAVYALADLGILCVIAPSFGDIFAGNAVNNGLLPAQVSEEDAEDLIQALEGGLTRLSVDLDARQIAGGDITMGFAIDPVRRLKLLNGWDDVTMTLSHAEAIHAFAAADAKRRPWAQLAPPCGFLCESGFRGCG